MFIVIILWKGKILGQIVDNKIYDFDDNWVKCWF